MYELFYLAIKAGEEDAAFTFVNRNQQVQHLMREVRPD